MDMFQRNLIRKRRCLEIVEDVSKTIEKINMEFGEGFRKGDAAAVAALYSEDAVLLPPNREKVRGRQKIREFWNALMQMGVRDAVLTTEELSLSGDTVQEIGNYTIKIQPEGQAASEDKGKYIVIWKRTADGWKMHWDIWNSNMPSQK